jgi:hypothetical protein
MKKVILLLLGILILHACGYQEGIVQKGEKSFIKFAGNWENAAVQIDDMNQFVLKSGADSEKSSGDDNKLYQVSPGSQRGAKEGSDLLIDICKKTNGLF